MCQMVFARHYQGSVVGAVHVGLLSVERYENLGRVGSEGYALSTVQLKEVLHLALLQQSTRKLLNLGHRQFTCLHDLVDLNEGLTQLQLWF